MSSIRPATHAGSWYPSSEGLLGTLQKMIGRGEVVPGAKALISPHAGYKYCGETMSLGYGTLDFSNVKRCIIMGPSHHVYFKNRVQVTSFDGVQTPFGTLQVDSELRSDLIRAGHVGCMEHSVDMDEHSLEMQFPMLYAAMTLRGVDASTVKILPMLVSHNSTKVDFEVGKSLKQYVEDKETIFIISSDFCHWGKRFGYLGYVMDAKDIEEGLENDGEIEALTRRSFSHSESHTVPIYKSIEILDKYGMQVLSEESVNKYYDWKKYITVTGNTICGERPIGIFLCAMSFLERKYEFIWADYSQSSKCQDLEDSSVSYASGYVIVS